MVHAADHPERLAELEVLFLHLVAAFEALRAEHDMACRRIAGLELTRMVERQAA